MANPDTSSTLVLSIVIPVYRSAGILPELAAQIHAEMKRMDLQKFTLVNRGFHWINELPYNL